MTTPRLLPWTLTALFACQTGPGPKGTPSRMPGGDRIVAQWDNGKVAISEVEKRIADELRQMDIEYQMARYERVRDVLDGAVEEALVDQEVTRRGLADRASLFRAEVADKVEEPTEEELRVEFDRFVENMPHATFESSRGFLRDELIGLRKQARQTEFLHELKVAANLDMRLPFPDVPRIHVPIHGHDPTMGSEAAPVTIVQFSGFQCYYCRRVNPTLKRLLADMPDKVRLVHKDFPIAGHSRAKEAAQAAHCADGKFWEMADILLENQGRLEPEHLRAYAQHLQLDLDGFDACMEDDAFGRNLEQDIHLGRELGVTSTPTFFVNGVMITGALSYDRFADLVDQELASAKHE